MKPTQKHSTNYFNTFIQIAPDSKASSPTQPPQKSASPTIANLQFDLISKNPYQFTSDEVLFKIHAIRKDLLQEELESEFEKFFSKGQPCFRASPLTKSYGFGIHFNNDGKMALFPVNSQEYQSLSQNNALKQLFAMRSKK